MSNNELQAAINTLVEAIKICKEAYLHDTLRILLELQTARASAIYTHDKSDEILD